QRTPRYSEEYRAGSLTIIRPRQNGTRLLPTGPPPNAEDVPFRRRDGQCDRYESQPRSRSRTRPADWTGTFARGRREHIPHSLSDRRVRRILRTRDTYRKILDPPKLSAVRIGTSSPSPEEHDERYHCDVSREY